MTRLRTSFGEVCQVLILEVVFQSLLAKMLNRQQSKIFGSGEVRGGEGGDAGDGGDGGDGGDVGDPVGGFALAWLGSQVKTGQLDTVGHRLVPLKGNFPKGFFQCNSYSLVSDVTESVV